MKTARVGNRLIEITNQHIYAAPGLPSTYDYLPWNIIAHLLMQSGVEKPTLVDIGANVGDSLAHFRRNFTSHAICVEPSEHFFQILQKNAQQFGDVQLINKLLAPSELRGKVVFTSGEQTGSTKVGLSGEPSWTGAYVTLEEIYGNIHSPFVLKVDTDGFDFEIVSSALPLCKDLRTRPILLMFEGPDASKLTSTTAHDYVSLCTNLQKIGYDLMFLTNIGLPYIFAGRDATVVASAFASLAIGYAQGRALCHYFDIIAVDARLNAESLAMTTLWQKLVDQCQAYG